MRVLVLSDGGSAKTEMRRDFKAAEALFGIGAFVHVADMRQLENALHPNTRVNLLLVVDYGKADAKNAIKFAQKRKLSVLYCSQSGETLEGAACLRLSALQHDLIRSIQPHLQI